MVCGAAVLFFIDPWTVACHDVHHGRAAKLAEKREVGGGGFAKGEGWCHRLGIFLPTTAMRREERRKAFPSRS